MTYIVARSSEAARERAAQAQLGAHEWLEVDTFKQLEQLGDGDRVLFTGQWFARPDAVLIERAVRVAANR